LRETARAADKRALTTGEAVVSRVSIEEGPAGQLAPDRLHGTAQARRVGVVVAHDRHEQQAGIQVLAAGVADIAALRRRPALGVHEAAEGGRLGAPARRARAGAVAR